MVKKTLKRLFGRDFYNFIKHAKNYISAEFFAKGVVFLSLPIFTRLLVPKEFGYISIFTSIVQIFTIIASLGVNGTVTRFYHDKNIKFDEFYGSVTIFILLWSIIISILLVFFSSKLSIFFNIPKGLIYIAIGLIFPSILVKILFSYFIASQKSKKVAIIKIIRSISYIIIAICITLVLDKYKYYGIPISKLFVGIIIFFFSFYIIREKANFTIKKKHIKYLLHFGVPIVFFLLSDLILKSSDRIIINQLVGPNETGLYSFAYKIGMIQYVLSIGAIKAWSPIFYQKMNSNKYNSIRKLSSKYTKLIYFISLILVLFSKEIVLIMADSSYHKSLFIIPIVIFSYIFYFLYTIYSHYVFFLKKTYVTAFITVVVSFINIVLNYVFIPIYGYSMAAWSTLLSYILLLFFLYIYLKNNKNRSKIVKISYLLKNSYLIIILGASFCFLRNYITSYFFLLFIKITMIIISVVFLFNYKKMICLFNKNNE